MLMRPEGLSPCYQSLASPDIPNSATFSWIFRQNYSGDYQTSFQITLYDAQQNVLTTYTKQSGDVECNMSDLGYNFQLGTNYIWSVQTWNKDNQASTPSILAYFTYDSCPASPSILWTYIPKQGEVIVRNTYFQELKNNLSKILSDYENVPSTLLANVNNLFTHELIPSKKDFDTLQGIVDYLSSTLEGVNSLDIYKLVSDSLGISDLEKIRNHISTLLTIPPKPPVQISMTVDNPTMYNVINLNAVSQGVQDKTIDLSWDVQPIPVHTGQFIFNQLSPSRDVRYYMCIFEYGPSARSFFSTLYFKADALQNGASRTFQTNWAGLYTAATLGTGGYTLRVTAVDHRGNFSETVSASKTFSSNFKAPLGVDHYEISYEALALNTTAPVASSFRLATTTTNKSYTYTITGGSGQYFYSIVGVDISGLKTAPVYSQGIAFDPLKPPAAPANLHVVQAGTTSMDIAWNPVLTATSYDINRYTNLGSGWTDGIDLVSGATTTACNDLGLTANTNYGYFVRASNKAGSSPWVGLSTKTNKTVYEKYWNNIHTHSWREGFGWHIPDGHNHTLAYQGDYGHGRNRGMWYYDNNDIANNLAGADILDVQLYVQCVDERYSSGGYPCFWMHNHNMDYGGYPYLFDPHAWGQVFREGNNAWVKLPVSFGEKLRDRAMQGIAVYTDDGSNALGFNNYAQLYIKYQK